MTIQEMNSTFTGQKQTKELLLSEEYNSERISTSESNEKSYIIVSNSGHVYRRRKEKRIKNETIEDYNSNQTKLKTLYNNQKEMEHNIAKITEGINSVLLEKEISTRKKLLSKAIAINRKKQESIKKEKIKEYYTNKINKESKSPNDNSQLITFFSSCGPTDEESDENTDNCTLV